MSDVLLHTKLHVPSPRRALLPRARLTRRIGTAAGIRLTLVSAPAGFGKSTVLSEWSSSGPQAADATAWVSLDQRDNDPEIFWAYVVAALRTIVPDLGAAWHAHPPAQEGLEQLLNDLEALGQELHLVLDDYHVITSPAVHESLAFLLDHLPSTTHLVLATRSDPPLQLARLRAAGQLLELRASDLRFTADEASTYLRESMGLSITEQDIKALDSRTEGWVAALQLAGLSMQGRQDIPAFIAGFTGDDRYIVDYLVEEVLQRLPADVRQFLLHTCVLGRFNGALCDAVTTRTGGKATLEALDRENLFVVPLDDQRRWYRYHHLFADVLRARLLDEEPELVPELHRRASQWHHAQEDLAEAVHHALEGEHWDWAADLMHAAVPGLRRHRREATIRAWVEALPDPVVQARPVLAISYVGSLMSCGDITGVEPHLQAVETWLAANPDSPTASDPLERTLPGTVAMYRAGLALLRGDVEGTITHAQRALALAGEDDYLERGAAAALLGLAHWSNGDVESATARYTESIACMHRAGHVADMLGCTIALADLQLTRGRLNDAIAAYEQALAAAEREPTTPRGTADMHTGLATLLLERGEVDTAVQHLHAGTALGDLAALPQNAYRWRLAMAEVRRLEGDVVGAIELLDEAERLYDTDYSPDVRPVAAVRARLQVRTGRLSEATAWARERGLSLDDEPSYLREYEHLTLARLALQSPTQGAELLQHFLQQLRRAAEDAGRTGSLIDVLLLQAREAHARQETGTALEHLQDALELAAPQAYLQSIIDHGPHVTELLKVLAKQPGIPVHLTDHLARITGREVIVPLQAPGPDRLSDRELEVLRLLASELDGPDIARTLFVSVNTVRTHTKSIYTKLAVNNRRAAVRRAHELGLLTGATPA